MDRRQIPNDVPLERSVAILSPLPINATVRLTTGSPAMDLPNRIGNSSARTSSLSATTASTLLAEEKLQMQSASRPQVVWRLSDDALTDVCPYYPLEKTQKTIAHDDATPAQITERLCTVFREMDMAATYDCEQATAHLITPNNIEIDVNLFRDPEQRNATIVEVQKMRGCSMSFHKQARRILHAAVRGGDSATSQPEREVDQPRRRAYITTKALSVCIATADEEREAALRALQTASRLLHCNRLCANTLGMESLVLLTDAERTSPSAALLASRVVLINGTGDEGEEDARVRSWDIRTTILTLVEKKQFVNRGNASEEGDTQPYDEQYIGLMHNLALKVLSNALGTVANEGTGILCQLLEGDAPSDSLAEGLVPSLIFELRDQCNQKPNDACLSARCLRRVVQASTKDRELAYQTDARNAIHHAREVGHATHASLEKECDSMWSALYVR